MKVKKRMESLDLQEIRVAGRVGSQSNISHRLSVADEVPDPQGVIAIYHRLLKLRDVDESELSKAICYSLKLHGKTFYGDASKNRSNSDAATENRVSLRQVKL
ncbi:MAG: hypothetical protein H7249_02345 [Chitinophagaceae bacterium]|nr:hypothetical protein [Oligoflexus sp.]